MLVGRERELNLLAQRYQQARFEMPVIYGRRRVGKTALIRAFAQDKPAIYYAAVESNAALNLRYFSDEVTRFTGVNQGAVYPDVKSALEAVFKLAETQRLVMVLDEYPYWAKAAPELSSVLQLLIDRYREHSKLFLILCGSSMSFMEEQVLSYQAPLYGRRTAQIKIEPLDFFSARPLLGRFPPEHQAIAYGCVGGTPQYLNDIADTDDIGVSLCNHLLSQASYLHEEPLNLLKQEVRDAALYNAVLAAVAGGATRQGEIAEKAGLDTDVAAMYLKNLQKLGLIQKETPIGEKPSRRTLYRLMDNLFRFWYRFIPPNASFINLGKIDWVWQRVQPQLDMYMGAIFEDICRQYLWRQLGAEKLPILFTELGRWWGTDSRQKKQVELDLLGADNRVPVICGECKWRREKTDVQVLNHLLSSATVFSQPMQLFWLFSRSGFTQACVERAERLGNVRLVSYAEMLETQ